LNGAENFHMASADVGKLAARGGPDSLVVFHLSDRYTQDEWREQLEEVRKHFAGAVFPEEWKLP
jgi:ribonuclease BN (tRNA processing enzyme)